ncbi:MAG TPA: bi-domain-containing oxidoreductase [Anaerolineales bacterium]|jgi:predicted dehydrogenase/threonine dehydrogenase-like Zn-dependent dehydrogenase
MKQVVQDLNSGRVQVLDVPVPSPLPNAAKVRTLLSAVSPGTERSATAFGAKNLAAKALDRPDLVRQVIDKAQREGLLSTIEAVRNRLDQPVALGYASVGVVEQAGPGSSLRPGQRVACAGGGRAVHAEYAVVPDNLLALVPDGVPDEAAALTTLGAVVLHGFRLAQVGVGGRVAVIGLGLLGQLGLMIARAAGCQAFGVDVDEWRVDKARSLGAAASLRAEAEEAGLAATGGQGFDAVLVCADTPDSDPLELAGALARDRAYVIAIGAVGMELPRRPYYDKELTFLVSRSYGPGRYDANYEERGSDYPIGYVRWTEGRNLAAFLDLAAAGKIDPAALITHRFEIDKAPEAYELIKGPERSQALGVLLVYPGAEAERPAPPPLDPGRIAPISKVRLGVIGAGGFASNVALPVVAKLAGVDRVAIASARGLNAAEAARRYGFGYAAAGADELLRDETLNTLAVFTRHDLHAELVAAGLEAGKHVFCEKPLALSAEQLDQVRRALADSRQMLTVGFNRRFAPLMQELKAFVDAGAGPLVMAYRVNAGALPPDHWLYDAETGGGRLVGEGCHFIDAMTFLCGAMPIQLSAQSMAGGDHPDDNFTLTIGFADGSIGTLVYTAAGDRAQGKERLEVFRGGRSAVLDDFRRLTTFAGGRRSQQRAWLRQDKGHRGLWQAFVDAIGAGGPPPIAYEQLLAVSQAALAGMQSLGSGQAVRLENMPTNE